MQSFSCNLNIDKSAKYSEDTMPIYFQLYFRYFIFSQNLHDKVWFVVSFSTTIDTIETKSVIVNKQFGTGNCTKLLLGRYYCLE